MKKIYSLLSIILISTTSQAQVVISQAYGGGGNGGATYSNDFIELFNRGTSAQDLAGWSVQYASAAGSTWFRTNLPSFILQPGQYYLIQQAAGATPVLALPTPDLDALTCGCTYNTDAVPAVIATGIAMSGSNGKVILVNNTTSESTSNPTGSQILDKVGYGATPVGFEGTGPTGTALTSSTSVQRNNNGCADTDNNPTDFTTATPAPRNSASTISVCSLGTNENSISGLKVYVNNKNLYVTSDSNEKKSVLVYDLLGKLVVSTVITNQEINVSELASGTYIVKVTENEISNTLKVSIQ